MQYLILHKPFRAWPDILQGFDNSIAAYTDFTATRPDQNVILGQAVDLAMLEVAADQDNIPGNDGHDFGSG